MSIWGVHAPADTPIDIRSKIRQTFVDVMNTPDINRRLVDLGYNKTGSSPDELDAETKRLVARWIELGRTVKLSDD